MLIAEVFFYIGVFLAFCLLPYSIAALYMNEGNRSVRIARRDPHHHLQPALGIVTLLAKINLFAAAYLIGVTALRIFAQLDPQIEGQPDWSLALSMVSMCVLLVVLWTPSVALARIKNRVMRTSR